MASILWVHEPDTFFLQADTEISEKQNFFVNCSVPENFQWEIFLEQVPTESFYALKIQKMYMKGGYNKCLTLFWLLEVG